MNLSTIDMTREEAEAAYEEWAAAAKGSAEDAAIAAGYDELRKGRRLISLSQTIAAGGEDDLGRPRLAVAPTSAGVIYLVRTRNGSVGFSTSDRARPDNWDWTQPVSSTGRVLVRGALAERAVDWDLRYFGYKAMVPVVPPRFRWRGVRSAHVLFEAEWAKHNPPAPVDPALIRHLRGDLWVVRGVWDLTDLERAVLMERNR